MYNLVFLGKKKFLKGKRPTSDSSECREYLGQGRCSVFKEQHPYPHCIQQQLKFVWHLLCAGHWAQCFMHCLLPSQEPQVRDPSDREIISFPQINTLWHITELTDCLASRLSSSLLCYKDCPSRPMPSPTLILLGLPVHSPCMLSGVLTHAHEPIFTATKRTVGSLRETRFSFWHLLFSAFSLLQVNVSCHKKASSVLRMLLLLNRLVSVLGPEDQWHGGSIMLKTFLWDWKTIQKTKN